MNIRDRLNGLFGINIPEVYGGEELSLPDIVEVVVNLSSQDLSAAAMLGSHMRVAHYINHFGTEEQKEKFLSKLASGEIIGAHARTEHESTVRATKEKDGYVLDGIKPYVTNAEEAGLFVVTANSNNNIFLVERDTPDFVVGKDIPRTGVLGTSLCSVYLNDCKVSPNALLSGTEGQAKAYLEETKKLALINYVARTIGTLKTLKSIVKDAPPNAIPNHDDLVRRVNSRIGVAEDLVGESIRKYQESDPSLVSFLSAGRSGCVDSCMKTLTEMLCSYTYTNITFAQFYRDVPSLAVIGGGRR